MKRLIQGTGKNSPQEYDRIFAERAKKSSDWFDMRRWKYLLKYFCGGDVADFGCLDSQISALLKSKHKEFTYDGFDVSPVAIENMRFEFSGNNNIQFWVKDITDPLSELFINQRYDYIVMGELIEHLEEPQKAIQEAFWLLKPDGILALSTPYNEAREPGAVDCDRHIWSFDKQDMYNLTKDYGTILKIKILGSRLFPYKYAFPTMVAFIQKNA